MPAVLIPTGLDRPAEKEKGKGLKPVTVPNKLQDRIGARMIMFLPQDGGADWGISFLTWCLMCSGVTIMTSRRRRTETKQHISAGLEIVPPGSKTVLQAVIPDI